MYYVYILQSTTTHKFYIGSTSNISKRLSQHNKGKNRSTKNRGPFVIVYQESYQTRSQAFIRELQIKSYKGGYNFHKLLLSVGSPAKRDPALR